MFLSLTNSLTSFFLFILEAEQPGHNDLTPNLAHSIDGCFNIFHRFDEVHIEIDLQVVTAYLNERLAKLLIRDLEHIAVRHKLEHYFGLVNHFNNLVTHSVKF